MKFRLEWVRFAALAALGAFIVPAQTPSPASDNTESQRIFGVLPNFLTVSDPHPGIEPLTFKEKFILFAKQTYDPATIATAGVGAAISQGHDDDPKYGEGWGPYGERFGAAVTDLTTQNFFGGVLLAGLFHEDPRYFRKGPQFGFWNRLGYSFSRIVMTRTDAGNNRFNYSGILGMGMGIALSNAYYPAPSVNGTEVASRFGTSFVSAALANILPEFWPDMRQKFFHKKEKAKPKEPSNPGP